MSEAPPLIELCNVSRTYRDHVRVRALRGVSLTVNAGSFLAVVGPSGSGKTTLLNILGALDRPDEGNVRLAGVDLAAVPTNHLADFRLHHVGFVFQAFNLLPVLSVEENMEFVPALQGVRRTERQRRVAELLSAVGLADIGGKRPNELSGGQQQRVAVLRAIIAEPEIVLADEPTANLDSSNAAVLLDMMERLNSAKGITFIFSTHDPQVMERARRLVRLKDGAIVADETLGPRKVPA
jgi:putative ABC transport system ATP-binding protein